MLSMDEGAGASGGRQYETREGGEYAEGLSGGYERPEESSTGGITNNESGGSNRSFRRPRCIPEQQCGRTKALGKLTRGRWTDQLKEHPKTGHGCRKASKVASVQPAGGYRRGIAASDCARADSGKWRHARVAGGAQQLCALRK